MGVITEQDVDYGRIFGPFPDVGTIPQSDFIGLLTGDDKDDGHKIKVNISESGSDVTWLPYVHPARTEEEQNMEAYVKEGRIYYRTLCIIRAQEELLVWYSKDFTQVLQIPTVKRKDVDDADTGFTCEFCGERFKHAFTVMAHMKFKCKESKQGKPPTESFSQYKEQLPKNYAVDLSPVQQCMILEEFRSCKRTADAVDVPTPSKRSFYVGGTENDRTDQSSNQKHRTTDSSADSNENWSAFRKVEKSHLREIDSNAGTHASDPAERNINCVTKEQEELKQRLGIPVAHSHPHEVYGKRPFPFVPFDSRLTGGVGMIFPGNWMISGQNANPAYSDRIPYRNGIHIQGGDKLPINAHRSDNSAGFKNLENSTEVRRQLLIDELRKTQYSYMKAANPMAGKYMAAPAPMVQMPTMQNLAQNWCAKCNATFRMTSDLVYHMRSHHKREFDPMKRKREDKLQCNVCHETFKERHHLTRHMTSHV